MNRLGSPRVTKRVGGHGCGWALSISHLGKQQLGSCGPPARCPFTFFSFEGEGSPTKIERRKIGTLILTSLLEDLERNNPIFFLRCEIAFVYPQIELKANSHGDLEGGREGGREGGGGIPGAYLGSPPAPMK